MGLPANSCGARAAACDSGPDRPVAEVNAMHDMQAADPGGWMPDGEPFDELALPPSAETVLLIERVERVRRAADELADASRVLWDEYAEGCRALIAAAFADLDMNLSGRRPSISRWMRERVLERDEHRCVQCGATELLHIDHIKPVVKGGLTVLSNLQVLCRSCNLRKAGR